MSVSRKSESYPSSRRFSINPFIFQLQPADDQDDLEAVISSRSVRDTPCTEEPSLADASFATALPDWKASLTKVRLDVEASNIDEKDQPIVIDSPQVTHTDVEVPRSASPFLSGIMEFLVAVAFLVIVVFLAERARSLGTGDPVET